MHIEIGDVVMLKSGGPRMTVSELGFNVVECTWFNKSTPCHRYFEIDVLRKVEVQEAQVIPIR